MDSNSKINNRTITVRGLGAVTGFDSGHRAGAESFWQNIVDGKSSLSDGLGVVRSVSRSSTLFLNHALDEALTQAKWNRWGEKDALFIATTTGQVNVWENVLGEYFSKGPANCTPTDEQIFRAAFEKQPLGELGLHVRNHFEFPGSIQIIASACSAATQAFGLAYLGLKTGRYDRCIVLGVEVLSTLTTEGFRCLQLLINEPCKPFDRDRNGINLSEGAAAICLEVAGDPSDPGLGVALTGYGITSDAYHMTAPEPNGEGALRAMNAAISCEQTDLKNISWIHAHGTGSVHNDQAESRAIEKLFQKGCVPCPPVVSTKGYHGHALGASGALESILCVQAIRDQKLLKTMGLINPDPELKVTHSFETKNFQVHSILKSTLGFGGANAAVLWSKF